MIKRDYFMDGRYFMRGIIGTAVGMALLAVTLAVMAVCGGLNPDHCRDYLVREGADPDVIREPGRPGILGTGGTGGIRAIPDALGATRPARHPGRQCLPAHRTVPQGRRQGRRQGKDEVKKRQEHHQGHCGVSAGGSRPGLRAGAPG